MDIKLEQRIPFAVGFSFGIAKCAGQLVINHFGATGALDNNVELAKDKAAQAFGTEGIELSLDGASPVTLSEVTALQRFTAMQGPRRYAELAGVDPAAPPEPFALKVLERIMEEEIDDPLPEPPKSQTKDTSL